MKTKFCVKKNELNRYDSKKNEDIDKKWKKIKTAHRPSKLQKILKELMIENDIY